MTEQLKPGDQVVCHIRDSTIVSAYDSYDEELKFEVIGYDITGYYLYVPFFYNIKDTATITTFIAQSLEINKKYIGGQVIHITSTSVVRMEIMFDGCVCARCGEFFPQSEPNQPDGSMKCFLCRTYHYR